MKYDDASWHYGGEFPDELPPEAGATHIGMFVAWGMINGLAGILYTDDFPEELENLIKRKISPGAFLIESSDEKFVDEDLNDEGNAFAEAYYETHYFSDYEDLLAINLPSVYHVADTWENYDKLAPMLEKRFAEWKSGTLPSFKPDENQDQSTDKPWWKIW